MKSLFVTIGLFLAFTMQGVGQVPQQFSYQAVLRNTDGSIMANQAINVKISLHKISATGDVVYTETQNVTTTAQGIISLTIGAGNTVDFALIPWSLNIFIQVEIKKTTEVTYQNIGTSQILSVPYALQAGSVKEVASSTTANIDDPIFEVKNKEGKVVFGVYQGGVRVYVDDAPSAKGARGGFAVGGLTNQGKGSIEYMHISPDSARIYFNNVVSSEKGTRGGFAVGGLTNQGKGLPIEYMHISPDSARIYINDASSVVKGARGGFAVGGLTNQGKSGNQEYFKVTKDTSYFTTTLFATSDIVSTGSVDAGAGAAAAPVQDVDGNIYKTVMIGTQTWFKENLQTTHYADNSVISAGDVTAYKDNINTDTLKVYGRLYSLTAVTASNLCPTGWRVPTYDDWYTLMSFVGGYNWESAPIVTGLRIMETGTLADGNGYWKFTNNGNNISGFSGRPAGYFFAMNTDYFYKGTTAYWRSSDNKLVRLDNGGYLEILNEPDPTEGYSVRCVKN